MPAISEPQHKTTKAALPPKPLKGVRVLSLAQNMPGPAALMRCRSMGATCIKIEPPTGDPMSRYNQHTYVELHQGIKVQAVDLKTEAGQKLMHRELAKADILLSSFRPSAIQKLGLGWKVLRKLYPRLSHIAIFGSPAERAEEPGHDLTYVAENDLLTGLDLPATLYADMSGSLMASEAILQAVLVQRSAGKGVFLEVALSSAAAYLALPKQWGLTQPDSPLGGSHAGYRLYPCKDGRVALAALEPHFAKALCVAAGLDLNFSDPHIMLAPKSHQTIAQFLRSQTRKQLDKLALANDIPLHTMP